MKHSLKITFTLLLLFLASQLIGLVVADHYINRELPFNIERPEFTPGTEWLWIILAILMATIIAYILARFKAFKLWKFWFFLSVLFALSLAFNAFFTEKLALALALILALLKVFKQDQFSHNISELFIYGGLAAIFVPILPLFSMVILLILISIYDVIAVWKTKHMVTLAKFQSKSKLFAGLHLKYKKNKEAILGGGDIGFPLLFAGIVLAETSWLNAIIVVLTTTIALGVLLFLSQKNKFYPAMPFISAGCFIGYGLTLLI